MLVRFLSPPPYAVSLKQVYEAFLSAFIIIDGTPSTFFPVCLTTLDVVVQATIINFSFIGDFQRVSTSVFWKGCHPYVTNKSKSLIGQSWADLVFNMCSMAACFVSDTISDNLLTSKTFSANVSFRITHDLISIMFANSLVFSVRITQSSSTLSSSLMSFFSSVCLRTTFLLSFSNQLQFCFCPVGQQHQWWLLFIWATTDGSSSWCWILVSSQMLFLTQPSAFSQSCTTYCTKWKL